MRDITVPALTHELGADADESFDPDGGPWVSSGIAVAPGDILHMDDGTPVLMTEEELRKAAPTQADEPLSVDHPTDDDGNYAYPPPSDATAGKVPKAGYIDQGPNNRGVGYETSVHDPEIARGLHAENYEVSVHPKFELGDRDPESGAYVAENIEFRDLSVVSKGDSPSNTANWGASAELAAWANQTDISEELAASADEAGTADADDPQGLISSAVNGTLRALGFDLSDVDTDAATLAADETNDNTDTMTDREQQINALVDARGFEESFFEDLDDDRVSTMHSTIVEADNPGEEQTETTDNGGESTDDTSGNVVELDIGDHDSVDDYIADQAEQAVASAKEEESREELIATIAGRTDKSEESLADWPTDALEDKAESVTTTARLPGGTGRHTDTVAASHSGGDDDDGGYTTGVEGM